MKRRLVLVVLVFLLAAAGCARAVRTEPESLATTAVSAPADQPAESSEGYENQSTPLTCLPGTSPVTDTPPDITSATSGSSPTSKQPTVTAGLATKAGTTNLPTLQDTVCGQTSPTAGQEDESGWVYR
jgi:hypothetical protein